MKIKPNVFTSVKDGSFDDPETWDINEVPSEKCEVNIFHKIIAPREGIHIKDISLSICDGGKLQFEGFSFGGK